MSVIKEQLQEFRTKLLTVVEENNVLNEELKSGLINLMLQQETIETAQVYLFIFLLNTINKYVKFNLAREATYIPYRSS